METENYQIINKLESGFFFLKTESRTEPKHTIKHKHTVDIVETENYAYHEFFGFMVYLKN